MQHFFPDNVIELKITKRQKLLRGCIGLPLPLLAARFHLAYCLVASFDDGEARKPAERLCEALWATGRYLWEDQWNEALNDRSFIWPTPKPRGGYLLGSAKTSNPWD